MASSTDHTLEGEVEIKSSADKVFNVIRSQKHHLPSACSDKAHDAAVHEGSWETSGSVKIWKYTMDKVVAIFKEKIEVDEQNKIVILTGLEEHALDLFKSYKINLSSHSEGRRRFGKKLPRGKISD